MPNQIVINTGPLVALGKMDAFDLIAQLPFEFLCPEQIKIEIESGAAKGYAVTVPDWVNVLPLAAPLSPLVLAGLDRGEAEVIQLALERSIGLVCVDERKGRQAAVAAGLQVVGSLGLIAKAKVSGLIPAARPFIEKAMREGIFYQPSLVAQVLSALKE
ncbi:MAG: DUF3368 domain-containing protein [Blastocatellales bacterium]